MTVFVEDHYVRLQTDVTIVSSMIDLTRAGCVNELSLAFVRSIDRSSRRAANTDVFE